MSFESQAGLAVAAHGRSVEAVTAGEGQIRTDSDPLKNFLLISGSGTWSPAYMDRHFAELESAVQAKRAAFGAVRVLCDLSGSAVQSQETADRIKVETDRIYRAGDRVAVVVGSSLLKMQMKRILGDTNLQVFISLTAARTWLDAYA